MAEILTPILVSGIISVIVNIISISYQRWMQRESRVKTDKEIWYREIVFIGRQLRRRIIELEYSIELDPNNLDGEENQKIEAINLLMDDLETELDNAPPEIRELPVDSEIRKLLYWYRNPEPRDGGAFTTTDLKEGVLERVESVLDSVYVESDRIKSVPY